MAKGIIFDIKEFSIHDGTGARVTVFLKGCPLRCLWCHNPEGLNLEPQYNSQTGRLVGTEWESEELAGYLQKYRTFFDSVHGGVTFSGGEPTMQAMFLADCAKRLTGIHKLLDTSGFCDSDIFADIAYYFDEIYFDLKLADEGDHWLYTGVSNNVILTNLKLLMEMKKNVTLRMPMIPYITDTRENLFMVEKLIQEICRPNIKIHLLPYNNLAGGKYPIYGMEYPLKDWYRRNQNNNIRAFEKKMKLLGYEVINYAREEG